MEIKWNEGININLSNFIEIKKSVEDIGICEKINYIYLKFLKNDNDPTFVNEFKQFKYSLSPEKRIELSEKPENEIKINLKEYFQNILELIINNKLDINKELEKFEGIDLDRFKILINEGKNKELFYFLICNKFLNDYKLSFDQDEDPDYYLSFPKDFILEKDLNVCFFYILCLKLQIHLVKIFLYIIQ